MHGAAFLCFSFFDVRARRFPEGADGGRSAAASLAGPIRIQPMRRPFLILMVAIAILR